MSYKKDFMSPGAVTYLNTGSEGLLLKSFRDALQAYTEDKQRGSLGRTSYSAHEQRCRAGLASLVGVNPEMIGFTASASEGLNLLANSLSWQPGDEIVLTDLDHPTNVLPWLRLRERGVTPIVVPSANGKVTLDDILSKFSRRTRLVTVSLVSFKNGFRLNFLSELANAVHSAGALLSVDATQGIGRVTGEIEDADFLVASGYKWLCGMHGLGFIYVRPAFLEKLQPGSLGWFAVTNMLAPDRFETYTLKPGALRLQAGMPNFPAMYALNSSARYLHRIGLRNIEKSLLPLMRQLYEGLIKLKVEVLTPADETMWSGMMAFAVPEAEAIGSALAKKGVVVWSGDGRVRVSIHMYNEGTDVDMFLSMLRNILRAHRSGFR